MPNDIVPAGGQYDDDPDEGVRNAGINKLKGAMGGNVPFYKKRNTPAEVEADKRSDMADAAVTSMVVPRRK